MSGRHFSSLAALALMMEFGDSNRTIIASGHRDAPPLTAAPLNFLHSYAPSMSATAGSVRRNRPSQRKQRLNRRRGGR